MSMPSAPAAPIPSPPRLESVDLLRGLVMIMMALDHTRDYFHTSAIQGIDPTDLAHTSPWIFLTRWVTHFCAPIFCFLAGTGVFLAARTKPKRELSRFLLTRGLWLVLLEVTFFTWAWTFHFDLHHLAGRVIWMLGWSMIALAALIHLPLRAVAGIGLMMILLHNTGDGIKPEDCGRWAWLWQVLHVRGTANLGGDFTLRVAYPLIPWIGVMATGYAFGTLFTLESGLRQRWLRWLGGGMIVFFALLRWSNLYGNLLPWTPQTQTGFTLLSMLDCTKYPPSLCYLLMTLGPAMLFLAWADGGTPRLLRPLLAFGRVPMFYYLLHIPLIHALSVLMNRVRFGGGDFNAFASSGKPPPDAGVGLIWVYAVWLGVVIGLYPFCQWFADLKRRRRDLTWLSYF